LLYTFLAFNFLIFLFFLKYFSIFKKKNFYSNNIKKLFIKSISSLSFYSSFSISFANLIWRLFIIMFCGKILAGIYFAGFAIGSLPGTFFNNTFGPSIIKKKIKYRKMKNFLKYFAIILMLFLFIYVTNIYSNIFKINFDTQIICTFLSLLGSFFMMKGLYMRQYLIQKTEYKSQVFKTDILYSVLITSIVPLLFLFGGYKFIILAFLLSSITSNIIYGVIYRFYFKQ
ncbi:hypothetical protein, partial [Candidatus Pelagibacter sp. HIMB1710]